MRGALLSSFFTELLSFREFRALPQICSIPFIGYWLVSIIKMYQLIITEAWTTHSGISTL